MEQLHNNPTFVFFFRVFFIAWLTVNHVKYDTTRAKFGMRVTKLVRNEEKHTGFTGLKKSRCGQGVMYKMDVRALHAELQAQQDKPESYRVIPC